MYTGTVKFFDSRPEKRFGFIVPDRLGPEIFFHLNDGQKVKAGRIQPEFDANSTPERVPLKGDRVVFNIGTGSKGPKAIPWGYESEYQTALAIISDRPKPAMYRILQWFRTVSDGQKTEPTVLWTGMDLNERGLDRHYNPIYDRPGGNGDIDWGKYWEVSTDGGKTWTSCGCPSEYMEQFDRRGNRRIPR
ncbi:cold shock domain-containing protein [candidate division WWE3 bacterium]|uniref:Cold shock domain-containing protein n=1 Tax=candidate division WWE3 bacterium TaxID=2053526 RepID=A0A7X9DKW9_UNCKA|nr:cold shock domain-containing protein [candidate division WWE3 bacterium]